MAEREIGVIAEQAERQFDTGGPVMLTNQDWGAIRDLVGRAVAMKVALEQIESIASPYSEGDWVAVWDIARTSTAKSATTPRRIG